jgi:adenylate cyclase
LALLARWSSGLVRSLPLSLLVALLVWGALQWLAGPLIGRLDERSTDLAWRLTAQNKDERRLIIVDIDEKSLREIGPWPWPRSTQAQLIERLAQAGVSQQVYDVVFAGTRSGDDELAAAVRQHRPVLSQVFALQQGGATLGGQLSGAMPWPGCPAPFETASGFLANAPDVAAAASQAGHITPRIASDGVVRHVPAVICYQGRSYPALSLAAMLGGSNETDLALRRGTGWLDADWRLESAALAQGSIPLDAQGDLRVAWHLHPDSFISLSAADVLAGRVPAGLLDQAWVLVGSTAFGLHDTVATPFAGADAGLQVHAEIIAALIDGRTPYQPRIAPFIQLLAALLGVVALLGLRRGRLPSFLLPLWALAGAGALWLPHAWALSALSLWVGWASPALFVVLAGLSMGIVAHAQSRIDRDRLYAHLSSYLPAPVAAALALQPPSSAITASEQQVTVLFADIRNFSAYVEARPPDEAAAVLHTFFSIATRVVESHGGVIEAFQGDAVLAVWTGKPAEQARRALQAAVDLLAALQDCLPDPAPAGLAPLALGIGVETGPATVGSFGPASRRTHLVMGRTVTVASRLVDMTAELAHPILVGEGMVAQLGGGARLESMGTFLLEGMRVPHHIYACPLVAAPRIEAN